MKFTKRTIYILLVIIITIAIDQISKIWTRANVIKGSTSEIIGDFFTLHNVENKGAFLGMGSELNDTLRIILLLVLPVVVLAFVLRHILKDKTLDNLSLFAFSSIIGGGIANVFDRIAYGSVTDFWHIDLGGVFRTGIFNIADLFVTTGMIVLVIASFRKKKTEKEA
ncbi:signal peptidase II [Jejuia spongiicola]|uniref:Lipoprotein signal peptidase n=1 Tax=Jejuia spongiicola TaxID=2942207 RepID=A0ABT0QET9_9FLAO|nr:MULTISPECIES: signal peptidase II [Flavobacteriaceae]MCL6295460.1 signal peptidase II [Jejuia spongiicola]PIA81737.1 signal peptidase II [Gaetbulibacter sp. 4G1]